MRKLERRGGVRRGALALAVLATSVVAAGAITDRAGATKPAADGTHKVTLCHRTNSDANRYVAITVDYRAANGSLGNGGGDHTGHEGPVWSAGLKADHVKWGDIIPPYTYAGGSFPGQNWTAQGQAIHEAGCTGSTTPPPPEPCPYDPSIPADDPACVPPG